MQKKSDRRNTDLRALAFHPDYGLPDATRIAALRHAVAHGIAAASLACNVSESSLYRWRKAYSVADLMCNK